MYIYPIISLGISHANYKKCSCNTQNRILATLLFAYIIMIYRFFRMEIILCHF